MQVKYHVATVVGHGSIFNAGWVEEVSSRSTTTHLPSLTGQLVVANKTRQLKTITLWQGRGDEDKYQMLFVMEAVPTKDEQLEVLDKVLEDFQLGSEIVIVEEQKTYKTHFRLPRGEREKEDAQKALNGQLEVPENTEPAPTGFATIGEAQKHQRKNGKKGRKQQVEKDA